MRDDSFISSSNVALFYDNAARGRCSIERVMNHVAFSECITCRLGICMYVGIRRESNRVNQLIHLSHFETPNECLCWFKVNCLINFQEHNSTFGG